MAEGRAGRPGRVVEVDDSLLERDERRRRGEELRHRGPAELPLELAARGEHAAGPDDRDGDVRDGPAVNLTQRLHGGRY